MRNFKENQIKIFSSKDWVDYELLDTGEGEKLERFGPYTFVRPYEDAYWKKTLTDEWKNADGKFWSSKGGAQSTHARLAARAGGWKLSKSVEDSWQMSYKNMKFLSKPTPFRHFGFFPEHAVHWDFIEEKIRNAKKASGKPVKFLNLFGYTGVASLFALRGGAEVTHLDASKQVLAWAKENQKLNPEIADAPMRVIEDDVIKFLEREHKRGNTYDAVIMDPPKFGRGPKGETWKIKESLPILLAHINKVLSKEPLFVILTSYATDSSSLPPAYALEEAMKDFGGEVVAGELCLLETANGRVMSLANTAVWSR